jgi:spoIIIJ-associated protein
MDPRIPAIVTELLSSMGIRAERVTVEDSPVHPLLAVETTDAKELIGPRGEHLRALNVIARKIVEKQLGQDVHFLIDANGYHKERIVDIQTKARMLAERVRTFKTSTELAPMNAYERMIVHATFANDPEIETHSSGEGKGRHVVLAYKAADPSGFPQETPPSPAL